MDFTAIVVLSLVAAAATYLPALVVVATTHDDAPARPSRKR